MTTTDCSDVVTADAFHQATTQRQPPPTTRGFVSAPGTRGFNSDRRDSYDSHRERPPHERDYEPRRYDGSSRYSEAPPSAPPASEGGRLDQARKVQDLLASLGNVTAVTGNNPPPAPVPAPYSAPPPAQPYSAPPPAQPYGAPPSQYPAQSYPPGPPPPPAHSAPPAGYPPYPPNAARPPPAPPATAANYPPYPPPPSSSSYSPAASSYPPPANQGYPPAPTYPPAAPNYSPTTTHYPPPPASGYGAPPAASPPAPAATLPAQVLAMLNPQQNQQHPPYGAPPHQQNQDAYDPNNANVGSLLEMLPRK